MKTKVMMLNTKIFVYIGFAFFLLTGVGCASTQAQKSEESTESSQPEKEAQPQPPSPPQQSIGRKPAIKNKPQAIYRLALKYNDYQTAISAMYERIANNPGNFALRDTLASLYYLTESYDQCIRVCNDVLSKQPKNQRALNLAAMAFKKKGNNKQAVNAYKRLHKITGSVYHLYEASFLQFQMKAYDQCLKTIKKILKEPKAAQKTVTIQISETTQQTVPIKAAILNLKGAVYQRLEKYEEARKLYNQSLEATPDFMLPQQNIKELDNKEK